MQLVDAFTIIVRRTQLLDKDINPRLHYDNYCKDIQCFQYYGCSYTTYVTHIIDILCHHESSGAVDYAGDDCSCSDVRTAESCRVPSFPPCNVNLSSGLAYKGKVTRNRMVDYNFPNKNRGHLVHLIHLSSL